MERIHVFSTAYWKDEWLSDKMGSKKEFIKILQKWFRTAHVLAHIFRGRKWKISSDVGIHFSCKHPRNSVRSAHSIQSLFIQTFSTISRWNELIHGHSGKKQQRKQHKFTEILKNHPKEADKLSSKQARNYYRQECIHKMLFIKSLFLVESICF